MKQLHFDIFVYLSILTLCSSQRLLYHCDFDTDPPDACRFSNTGAPPLIIINGTGSNAAPTQPLSDVKSILTPTIPNNELCILPYNYSSETWPTYFCLQNSPTNYTCATKSGTGNCVTGRYGLVKMTGNGQFDRIYTTVNTVQNHINSFQCFDFHYYITDRSFDAKISIGWSAGAAPFPITEVTALPENKWQHHRFTYETPQQPSYSIWFQMIRDGGNADFSYALDEIKIFDGSCDSPMTVEPEITVSSRQTTSVTTVNPTSSEIEISTKQTEITTTKSWIVTDTSTDSPPIEQTAESTISDTVTSKSSSLITTTTAQSSATVTDFLPTNNHTIIETETTIVSTFATLFLNITNKISSGYSVFIDETLLPTIETNTGEILISSSFTTATAISTTPISIVESITTSTTPTLIVTSSSSTTTTTSSSSTTVATSSSTISAAIIVTSSSSSTTTKIVTSTPSTTSPAIVTSSSSSTTTIVTSSSSTTIVSSSSSTTTTIPLIISTKKSNLPLILGLVLGLGLPAILIITGALVYYFKVIKPKKNIIVSGSNDNEIPMT